MGEIGLTIRDGVALITLSAPERRNSLTVPMTRELLDAFGSIDDNSNVGCAVIRGANGYFCAGAHRELLQGVADDPAAEAAYNDISLIYDSFFRLGHLMVPTIAAVRGDAVGAGVNLLLAADLRVIAHDARLISGFLRIGALPGGGHFALLTRTAGREAAAAAAIFGEEINGARAAALGIAWESLEDFEVENRAIALAARVAADPELARRAIRMFRLIAGPPVAPWEVALQAERSEQMWSFRRGKER